MGVAVLALVVAPVAAATHPSRHVVVRANLDGDRRIEKVIGTDNVSSDHTVMEAWVDVLDRCGRRERRLRVVGVRQSLKAAELLQADGRGRPEVLGAVAGPHGTATGGQARVVRLAGVRGGCPRLRTLFAYDATRPPFPPPDGFALTSFDVRAKELEAAFPGRELELVEWYRIDGALSSRVRASVYRFARATDRYVLLRTSVATVP